MTSAEAGGRFRGMPQEARGFFEALDAEPCPSGWPRDRAAYAVHVLAPLKALVADLGRMLTGLTDDVEYEARVGRSLGWGEAESSSENCPVREIRFWTRGEHPHDSPLLYAAFSSRGIEVGVASRGADREAVERVEETLRAADGAGLAAHLERLAHEEWTVLGPVADGFGVHRTLPWDLWIEEPELPRELAECFLPLLPFFDLMRGRQRTASAGSPRDAAAGDLGP